MNIQGSSETRQMLKDSIEKLFFIPFFKLIEIFYDSLHDKEKYEKLKKENFGNNFEDIIILGTFKKQIEVIDKLLFASRPDILGRYENLFLQDIIGNNFNDKQMEYFNNKLKAYYKYARELQIKLNINCLDSQDNSIAKSVRFPENKIRMVEKKLFFFNEKSFTCNDFYRK